jgi:hypothetical protein
MDKKKNNGAKALIFGGVVVLLSTLETETMIPWYIKVVGALALIIYGISQLVEQKNK